MCRWLAYAGPPVLLDRLLFKPENSLISQSLRARNSTVTTNGDGFGVGWYARRSEPGLYRDYRPAWNDENLLSLAQQIEAKLFFAHVRASTGTATSRANCHPFRFGSWLFMHNGQIGGYDRIARELDLSLASDLYRRRQGTTDSETLFFLMLTLGLERDALGALGATVALVERVMREADVVEPLRLTAALTDGEQVIALRYASDGKAPTLFYGPADGVRDANGRSCVEVGGGALVVLSEPLDDAHEHWTAVPDGHVLLAGGGGVAVTPFVPERAASAA
jgi:glutamine amidotransferase